MKTETLRKSLILLRHLVLLLAVSCAKGLPPQIHLADFSAEALIDEVKAKNTSIRSLRGLAKVKIVTPRGDKVTFRQVTIVEEPNLVHLEARGLFGSTMGKLESNGSTVELTLPKERLLFERGEEFDLSVFYPGMPVTIGIEEFSNLLLARLPDSSYPSPEEVELSAEKGLLVLSAHEAPGVEKLWIEPRSLTLVRARVRLDGDSLGTYEFEDYVERAPGLYFPLRIEFRTQGFSLILKYDSDIEVNPPEGARS